ncbi:twin-arginine translocase subunit TatB [Betaproteobacteria bacterium SCN1]|jgi:sec-independent protein translocase protein TatB|nr:twin-arginine translocase subunit TatB [Betaproteobacteria bacterium SCN1]MBN8761164.1 twin-arginine translocase subunit TatB [Thiobacillus sp.]ODU87482.1 MAG: twin arginine-targeting protein translocase TatB [Thiobacillus sp. SCN 65-179]OJW38769.1 MAG: twin arginine-targeting protein translocase TatB [Thiobacillus sp. 65-69]
MFDIGFTELLVIGVVALIVIGPERLPKVARTAGHLYGRMQRYVTTVKADISREIQLDEMRKVGEDFKQSIESAASEVEQKATAVDDYLRSETSNLDKMVSAMAATEGERPEPAPPAQQTAEPRVAAESRSVQQSLPLDEPDQNPATPSTGHTA